MQQKLYYETVRSQIDELDVKFKKLDEVEVEVEVEVEERK